MRRALEQPRTRSPPLANFQDLHSLPRTRVAAPPALTFPPFSLLVERRAPGAEAQRPRRAALRESNPCTCPGGLPISAVPALVASSPRCFGQFVSPAPLDSSGLAAAGLSRSPYQCPASFAPTSPLRPSAGCGPTPRSSRRPTTAAALGRAAPWCIMRRSAKRARLRGRLSSNVGPQVCWLCLALSARSAAHTRRQIEQPRTRSPPLASFPNANPLPRAGSRLYQH